MAELMRRDCIRPYKRSEIEDMACEAARLGDADRLRELRQFCNYKHWLDW